MNKFLISVTIGVITFLCIVMFLYTEIKYPNFFNTLNNLSTLIASLATIFAACFAVVTMQDFKKQKRAELLSQLSKEKLETIDLIGRKLSIIFRIIKDRCKKINEDNITEYKFTYLSSCLQEIRDDEKLSVLCINFDREFANIYMLVNKEGKQLIINTKKLLQEYIGLLWCLNDHIKGYEYSTTEGQEKLFTFIERNQIIYKNIDKNIKELKALLNNSFLYL